MPPPTSSLKPAAAGKTGATAKPEAGASAPSKSAAAPAGERTTLAKPDKSSYDAEQDALNKEIAEIKTKLVRSNEPVCRM
jgi:hypothetical protein